MLNEKRKRWAIVYVNGRCASTGQLFPPTVRRAVYKRVDQLCAFTLGPRCISLSISNGKSTTPSIVEAQYTCATVAATRIILDRIGDARTVSSSILIGDGNFAHPFPELVVAPRVHT